MGKEYIGNRINNVLDEMINEAIAKFETYKETLKAIINVLMQGINIDSEVCDEEDGCADDGGVPVPVCDGRPGGGC